MLAADGDREHAQGRDHVLLQLRDGDGDPAERLDAAPALLHPPPGLLQGKQGRPPDPTHGSPVEARATATGDAM